MKTLRFFKTKFRVTQEEEEILKLTYSEPYLQFTEQPYFYATGICCPNLNSLLLYIENTETLSTRLIALQERIAKGLTPSKAAYRNWVEEGIASDLLRDAERMYYNDIGEHVGDYLMGEVREFFKFPSFKKDLQYAISQQSKIGEIAEPETKLTKIPLRYGSTKGDNSNYQCWGVHIENSQYALRAGYARRAREATGVNVGKLVIFGRGFGRERGNYIQIYLYDYAGRDWGFQKVLQYMVEVEGLKLDYSKD